MDSSQLYIIRHDQDKDRYVAFSGMTIEQITAMLAAQNMTFDTTDQTAFDAAAIVAKG